MPSSGSTAMSISSPPVPTFSPMKSIGASSRSPSPMTMVPSMSTSLNAAAHAFDGGVVGRVLVALAHPAASGERGGLGDLEHLDDTGAAHEVLPRSDEPRRRAGYAYLQTRTSRAAKWPSGPSDSRQRPEEPLIGHEAAATRQAPRSATESTRNALPASLPRERAYHVRVLRSQRQCRWSTPRNRRGRTRRAASREQP